jgi:hypothetical protein
VEEGAAVGERDELRESVGALGTAEEGCVSELGELIYVEELSRKGFLERLGG